MYNIVYLKKVDEYNDIVKERYYKIPVFFKKIIFIYKNMFNVITKKKIEEENIWIIPIQEKYSINKLESILKKLGKYQNLYVTSNDLKDKKLYKLMNKCGMSYLKVEKIKKYLIIQVLEYINTIQNQEMSNIEVTMLTRDISEQNVFLIDKLSRLVKSIKVVTPNIYKFKNLEEKLYNEFGIALQFSNSYKKSLAKSKIIINLDYNSIDINEYEIFNKAIILNCTDENIKIKSKLFNGIVINSYNIKLKKEIRNKFKKMNIYYKYNPLLLYESCIHNGKTTEMFEKIDIDKVTILNLIGNNGIINKHEIKNIFKKLDK